MNVGKIGAVLALIREFQFRANALANPSGWIAQADYPISGTKATGALRRTSMELTRALADLRRPG